MKEDELYDDFESWERDYELIENEDWLKLLDYRTDDLKRNPVDYYTVQRYLEALNYNKKFKELIEFVKERQGIKNEEVDIYKYEILDALFGLGLNENDFVWYEKPIVYRLDQFFEKKVVELLTGKRYGLSIEDIYTDLTVSDAYLIFTYLEFERFMKESKTFEMKEFRGTEKIRIRKK